jgi:hypothetical protein
VRLPGTGDFVGSYDPSLSRAHDGGQSTYNGSITVILIDRGLVGSVLPGNLRLAQTSDGGNKHPIIVLVGHQRDLKLLDNGVPRPAGEKDYQEVILLVPFVVSGSSTKWHTFVVGMYLDHPAAVVIGNTVFAYSKVPAALEESGPDHDLTMRVSFLEVPLPLFKCRVELAGAWRTSENARTSLHHWGDIQQLFEMPLVGVMAQTICSYWEWDYSAVEVAPTTAKHRFFEPLRPGMYDWIALGKLSGAPGGTFAIRGLRWRLAKYPPACRF